MKYYKYILITFLMSFYTAIQAQKYDFLEVDSLEILLYNATNKKDKSLILKELAYKNKNTSRKDALRYVEQALEIANAIKYDFGIAEATHTLGLIQFYLGDYELALSNYLKALEIRETLKDGIGLGRSYNNIGVIYKQMGKYELAEDYFNRGLILRKETKDSIGIVYSYNNLGGIYLDQKDAKRAITNYNVGLAIAKKIKNGTKARAFILENLGDLYQRKPDYEKALLSYNEALKLTTQIGGDYDIAKNLIAIGNIKVLQNNFDAALVDLEKGLELAQKLQAKPLLSSAYKTLSKGYAGIKNYEKAYHNEIQYDMLQDSLMSTSISNQILALQAKYEVEKKERQLLEQGNEISTLYRGFSIITFLFFLGFLGFIFYRYRQQVRANEHLKAAKDEIEDKNQQLAAYTKELEQFTYIASHDLKEPLRNIGGFARILDTRYRGVLDKKGEEYLNFIMIGVAQMTDLLKDLLQYSEIKRRNKEDLKWVDLNDLMLSIQNSLNGQIRKCNGQVIFNDLPKVYSNTFQMTQLFKNLISNGLKFRQKDKTPVVEVIAKDMGENWVFYVKDNGIGIDGNYHHKVFEIFKRLHKQKDFEGSGMGLAICKQIVEQHGGKISIDSEIGKGTSFGFTFPKMIVK
jgi:signal transduction histidine kinase